MENINWARVLLVAGVIFVSWCFYQNLVVLPREKIAYQKQQDIMEELEKATRERLYANCVENAYDNYNNDWKLNCKNRGLKEDCELPLTLADKLAKTLNDAKTEICPAQAENNY